jgi:hypothetical protein
MRNLTGMVLLILAGFASVSAHAAADARYVVNGGEVFDKNTNLTWQRCSVGKNWQDGAGCVGSIRIFNFDEAQQQAGGKWRVPTQDELATLIDRDRKEFPAIDAEAFPDMDQNNPTYWSSTPSSDGRAWDARFSTGSMTDDTSGYRFAVRLVRSGQ